MKLDLQMNKINTTYDEIRLNLERITGSIADAKGLDTLESIRQNFITANYKSQLTEYKKLISQLPYGTVKDTNNMNYQTLEWRVGTIPALIKKRSQDIQGSETTSLSSFKGGVLQSGQSQSAPSPSPSPSTSSSPSPI